MTEKKLKKVCKCENCGNEAEMVITCFLTNRGGQVNCCQVVDVWDASTAPYLSDFIQSAPVKRHGMQNASRSMGRLAPGFYAC